MEPAIRKRAGKPGKKHQGDGSTHRRRTGQAGRSSAAGLLKGAVGAVAAVCRLWQ